MSKPDDRKIFASNSEANIKINIWANDNRYISFSYDLLEEVLADANNGKLDVCYG